MSTNVYPMEPDDDSDEQDYDPDIHMNGASSQALAVLQDLQYQVEKLLLEGKRPAEIARRLHIQPGIVSQAIQKIRQGWMESEGVELFQKREESVQKYRHLQSLLFDELEKGGNSRERRELVDSIKELEDRIVALTGVDQIAKQGIKKQQLGPGAHNADAAPYNRVERNALLLATRATLAARK